MKELLKEEIMKNLKERRELFKVLVGSSNYNLNTENSNKDYIIFVSPTFDDLYNRTKFQKSYIGEEEDFHIQDIRGLIKLISNVNSMEVLFSKDKIINPCLEQETKDLICNIFNKRKEIAKANLPSFYQSGIGMHLSNMRKISEGNGKKSLIDKYGYDTKKACQCVRILDLLRRFADSNFNEFEFSLTYDNKDDFRELLLDIKHGIYSKEQFMTISNNIFKEVESKYKEVYLSKESNKEINEFLLNSIKAIIKKEAFTY